MENGIVQVRYPYLPCVARLRDNSGKARAILSNVEKNLITRGLHNAFNLQMEKAEAGGTFSPVSDKELQARRRRG